MIVNKSELRSAFDVDDTLVLWDSKPYEPGEGKVKIACPYEEGTYFYLKPHKRHINILKAKKHRGSEITVWSQNGWAWAEQVIKTLKLEDYVDKVETKFKDYVDDLTADNWMSHIFLEDTNENNSL